MTAGPVMPTSGSAAVLRPAALRMDDGPASPGFWMTRRQINAERSIPHALEQLRQGGQFDDLRRAAARASGVHSGRPYHDSDVYKTAEALAWAGGRGSGLAEISALVRDAQEDSGYLNSWFQATGTPHFSDLQLGHEMYCAGHLIQAGIAADRAGADTALLASAVSFADHLVDVFGEQTAICGHPEIETALIELYRHTGTSRYLELAGRMIDRRGHGLLGAGRRGGGYYQDETPIRDATELDGHCVRAMYLAAGAADVYLETGDVTLLRALTRLWDNTVATKTYLTGGVGCRRKTEAFGAPYELPPDQAFNETCAGVANVMWSWRMLLSTGDGRYADHIERILYNVVAAGVSLDGGSFSYINTLHRRGSAMEHGDKAPYRKPWFGCPCCPPNLMRLLASLEHYLVTTSSTGVGVQIHQYASGVVRATGLELDVRTDYPVTGTVRVRVVAAGADERAIGLRIPAWCRSWTVTVNDQPTDVDEPDHGYVHLRRPWRVGDLIDLDLALPARFTRPDRRIDAIRGCVAIERGPLVYCLEEVDLPPGVRLEDLTVDPSVAPRTAHQPELLGGVTTVAVTARTGGIGARPSWPYGPSAPEPVPAEEFTVTAIPYYAWDNRGRGEMRTWIPAGPPSS